MREHILLPAARQRFESSSPEDQRRFDEIFRALCGDPGLGTPVTTLPDELPVVFRYVERVLVVVVYDLPDAATLRVWGISWASATGN